MKRQLEKVRDIGGVLEDWIQANDDIEGAMEAIDEGDEGSLHSEAAVEASPTLSRPPSSPRISGEEDAVDSEEEEELPMDASDVSLPTSDDVSLPTYDALREAEELNEALPDVEGMPEPVVEGMRDRVVEGEDGGEIVTAAAAAASELEEGREVQRPVPG